MDDQVYIETPLGRIVIMVTRIDRGRVTLGIEAPKILPVVRAELVEREEKKRA